jgi:hypothetical protein
MNKADAVIHRTLIHWVRAEIAVEIFGAQVGDHFRRRHGANLNVLIGIEPVLREVVP